MEAVREMYELKYFKMAAVANAILGDDNAMEWLEKFNLKPFLLLAESIIRFYNRGTNVSTDYL